MDLQTIRTFVVVAEELHFRRAGDRLHLAQQAVSQQIKRLETDLGVELLRRTTRRVELTQAGAAFEADARRLLDQAEDMRRHAVAVAAGEQGRCRIGYDPTTVTAVLPAVLARCRRDAAGVELVLDEVCPPDLEQRLRAGGLDLGIAGPVVDLEGIDSTVLAVDRPVLAVPADHRLAAAASVAPVDLADEPIVAYQRTTKPGAQDLVDALFAEAGVQPPIAQRASSELAVLGLVAGGCGVGIVAGHTVAITTLPVAAVRLDPAPELATRLLWAAGRCDGPVQRLVTALDSGIASGSEPPTRSRPRTTELS